MSLRDTLLNPIKPLVRTAKLRMLKRNAEKQLRTPTTPTPTRAHTGAHAHTNKGENPETRPPVFIFACGRSGTTILGKLLAAHPQVAYLREPYHLWATIDPALDVTNLHVRTPPRLWWKAEDATDQIRERFTRLILSQRERQHKPILIEKTPHNIYRIGLLEALTEGSARYIHIVRDGVDVARSIDRLASNQPYKMAFRSDYNQWWGSNDLKWQRLRIEGPEHGCFTSEQVDALLSNAQRGAYEWLTSLAQAALWREQLSERLLEITYTNLTAEPIKTLRAIATHIGANAPTPWLEHAQAILSPERKNQGKTLMLPHEMAEQFNAFEEHYHFTNRAQAAD